MVFDVTSEDNAIAPRNTARNWPAETHIPSVLDTRFVRIEVAMPASPDSVAICSTAMPARLKTPTMTSRNTTTYRTLRRRTSCAAVAAMAQIWELRRLTIAGAFRIAHVEIFKRLRPLDGADAGPGGEQAQ